MTRGKKGEIISLVEQFLKLNDKNRSSKLSDTEVDQWYSLKKNIEQHLFSTPPFHSDRRKSIRVRNVQLPALYEGPLESKEAVITEISEGGVFLSHSEPEPVGTVLDLKIQIPDETGEGSDEIQLQAMVLYANTSHSLSDRAFSGMGMKFTDSLNAETQRRWARVLEVLLQQQAEMDPA